LSLGVSARMRIFNGEQQFSVGIQLESVID
jgi:hypothetical protein